MKNNVDKFKSSKISAVALSRKPSRLTGPSLMKYWFTAILEYWKKL